MIPRKVDPMSAAAEMPWTPPDSKTELHPVFEHAPFAVAQCQPQGNITAFNPALEQMLGGMPGIARARSFADLIDPRDRPTADRLLAELFGRHRDSFQLDSQAVSESQQQVRWTAWRVSGTNRNADYVLVAAQDSVASQEVERRLRQAESLETVGRLAGGVAHDFNNLLTGILLYCDLLLANLEPCHLRKYAEEIRQAGLQANGLVRQLLAVARPSTTEPRVLSLNQIVEGMHNLLARLIGENIEMEFQLEPKLGLVKIDPTHAQQILLNLVLNARDAMPGGGRITVKTSNCKVQVLSEQPSTGSAPLLPCALFAIEDNGSGMDAATCTHLFEAFFTTKGGKGTGLGLSTVYDIVTRNGGLIHVDSAPTRGTRVNILLPLIPEAVLNCERPPDRLPDSNCEVLIPKGKEEKE
jgi:two-component system cell cycle sensor histidine kinase/response regulator CckA